MCIGCLPLHHHERAAAGTLCKILTHGLGWKDIAHLSSPRPATGHPTRAPLPAHVPGARVQVGPQVAAERSCLIDSSACGAIVYIYSTVTLNVNHLPSQ